MSTRSAFETPRDNCNKKKDIFFFLCFIGILVSGGSSPTPALPPPQPTVPGTESRDDADQAFTYMWDPASRVDSKRNRLLRRSTSVRPRLRRGLHVVSPWRASRAVQNSAARSAICTTRSMTTNFLCPFVTRPHSLNTRRNAICVRDNGGRDAMFSSVHRCSWVRNFRLGNRRRTRSRRSLARFSPYTRLRCAVDYNNYRRVRRLNTIQILSRYNWPNVFI